MVSHDNVSMALFCDFENVALGVRDANYEKFDIRPVLERLLLKGSIVVKKAYCDWERYKGFKASMHEANFELIEIPHVRQSGKNSADIRLVVDALDLCYTKSHVDTFVIISGDSDFSPLVSKLRENAKHVIGVGVKQSTSDLLIANCDEFIFYDDLVRESQRNAARREPREAQPSSRRAPDDERRRKEEAEARKTKALVIASETFEALMAERGDGGKIWASVLKEAIKRRKPDFNESYYGFRAFGNLLEEAQARGLMEFGRDDKSGAYVYRANLSEGTEAGAVNAGDNAGTAAGSVGNAAATGAASERGAAAGSERGGAATSSRRSGRRDGRRGGQSASAQATAAEVNRADDALFEDAAPVQADTDAYADRGDARANEDAGGSAARSQPPSQANTHSPPQPDAEWEADWERTGRSPSKAASNPFDIEQESLPLAMPEPRSQALPVDAGGPAPAPDSGDATTSPARSRRGSRGRAAKKTAASPANGAAMDGSPANDAAAPASSMDNAADSAGPANNAAAAASSARGATAGDAPAQAGSAKPRAPRRGRRADPQAEPEFEAVSQAGADAQAAEAASSAQAGEDAAAAPRKSAARKTAARSRRPRKTAAGKDAS